METTTTIIIIIIFTVARLFLTPSEKLPQTSSSSTFVASTYTFSRPSSFIHARLAAASDGTTTSHQRERAREREHLWKPALAAAAANVCTECFMNRKIAALLHSFSTLYLYSPALS